MCKYACYFFRWDTVYDEDFGFTSVVTCVDCGSVKETLAWLQKQPTSNKE